MGPIHKIVAKYILVTYQFKIVDIFFKIVDIFFKIVNLFFKIVNLFFEIVDLSFERAVHPNRPTEPLATGLESLKAGGLGAPDAVVASFA